MINFAEGYGAPSHLHSLMDNLPAEYSMDELGALVSSMLSKNPYSESSYHGGLNANHIAEALSYLMYVENNQSVSITVEKSTDDYHLGMTIDKKEK